MTKFISIEKLKSGNVALLYEWSEIVRLDRRHLMARIENLTLRKCDTTGEEEALRALDECAQT